jgi:hypothetical protein
MKPDKDALTVMSLLHGLSLPVDRIPESKHRTPDLRIPGLVGDVLIEVKSKKDDKALLQMIDAAEGTVYSGRGGSIKSQIEKAWRQIRDYPDRTNADFAVVWFITRKPHGMTVLTRLHMLPLVYGTEQLEGRSGSGEFYVKPCFFFNAAMFQQYRELDAVVVHDDSTLTLCLNPLSPRYSRFRTTDLAKAFGIRFAVVDPHEMEAAGTCFLADSPPEPRTPDDVVRYLKAKYDLDTVKIQRFFLYNEPVKLSRSNLGVHGASGET